MEVAPFFVDFHLFCRFSPFFVDFHNFLSIFTIFYRFSRFTHFCRDLHFFAIYALFPQIFLAKIAISATSHVFCMYDYDQFGNAAKLVEKGVEIREASEQENCKSHYFAKRCLYLCSDMDMLKVCAKIIWIWIRGNSVDALLGACEYIFAFY